MSQLGGNHIREQNPRAIRKYRTMRYEDKTVELAEKILSNEK
jgi:hypothetical protein